MKGVHANMQPEIRCVPDTLDGWEVVSSRRCCTFAWRRRGTTGIVFLDSHRCAECRAEVHTYSTGRGWVIAEDGSRFESGRVSR